jgi:hypothetical protein
MVGVRPENDRMYGIVVCNGIFETLDDDRADSLSSTVPIGTVVKCFAVSSSGEKMTAI